jgi:hypothetical protein
VDDTLAELFLSEEPITPEQLAAAIRRATLANKFVPVFMGSAYKNKGEGGGGDKGSVCVSSPRSSAASCQAGVACACFDPTAQPARPPCPLLPSASEPLPSLHALHAHNPNRCPGAAGRRVCLPALPH